MGRPGLSPPDTCLHANRRLHSLVCILDLRLQGCLLLWRRGRTTAKLGACLPPADTCLDLDCRLDGRRRRLFGRGLVNVDGSLLHHRPSTHG